MDASQWLPRARTLVLCAVCAGAGWTLGDPAGETPPAKPEAPVTPPSAARTVQSAPQRTAPIDLTPPLIAVAHDGNVTLRVEQQPLEWVLEEIERQSGIAIERRTASRTRVACEPPPPAAPAVRNEDLLATLQRGTDAERRDALLLAQGDGGGVPESLLKTVYETDASPQVRLLAFEYALQAHAGDVARLKQALEASLYLPDAVIAHEAGQRLEALAQTVQAASRLSQGSAGP